MTRATADGLGLVADVGGTNVRIALTALNGSRPHRLLEPRYYRTADFTGVVDVTLNYLSQVRTQPRVAAFALAGIVRGEQVSITNCAWDFSIAEARQRLSLEQLFAVNDFAAIGWALPELEGKDQVALGGEWKPGLPADGTVAVLGPGTGLGVSAVQLDHGRPMVFATEGGHIAVAPGNDEEMRVLRCLQQRFGHVSYERVLSGPGLSNLYAILCSLNSYEVGDTSPESITRRAAQGGDPMSLRAVDLFCEWLGAFSGDAALMLGAWDGVYLAGGLVTALLDPLRRGIFRQRFEEKGRLSQALTGVPTVAIVRSDLGLVGAAKALRQFVSDGATGGQSPASVAHSTTSD
jgi:glucokinase